MKKNIFKDVELVPGRVNYTIRIVLQDGRIVFDYAYQIYSKRQLIAECKEAVEDFLEWDGRSSEVERVYLTRIDCIIVPEGVRRKVA